MAVEQYWKDSEHLKGVCNKYREPYNQCSTDLMIAVESRDSDSVKAILEEHKDDIDFMVRNGRFHSYLSVASALDDKDTVELLLSAGAPINWGGSDAMEQPTPLSHAIKNGHREIARLLLQKGANPNTVSHGDTPINLAVYNDDVESVVMLIEAGSKASVPDSYFDAIGHAETWGRTQIKEVLEAWVSTHPESTFFEEEE